MSKITFRADDDLVARIEAYDASKSEVMREALRAYLDEQSPAPEGADPSALEGTLDALVRDRVDELVEERIDAALAERRHRPPAREPQDVNVTVTLDGDGVANRDAAARSAGSAETPPPASDAGDGRSQCSGCGSSLDSGAVYCPNCGEKASHRVFCDCGDELRSDWSFCPGCGRRTPAADVLERS